MNAVKPLRRFAELDGLAVGPGIAHFERAADEEAARQRPRFLQPAIPGQAHQQHVVPVSWPLK